jgi:hypothetical protein
MMEGRKEGKEGRKLASVSLASTFSSNTLGKKEGRVSRKEWYQGRKEGRDNKEGRKEGS